MRVTKRKILFDENLKNLKKYQNSLIAFENNFFILIFTYILVFKYPEEENRDSLIYN